VLFELLREDRDDYDLQFSQVWDEDVALALSEAPDRWERAAWSNALGWSRQWWQAAYERRPAPSAALSESLLDET
jgi:hypothetical protein